MTDAVVKGRKKREELYLPVLSYIVADDWIDKIGYEPFGVWLKFHTMVDRKDANRDYDRIPRSFENIFKEMLKISKTKFYRLIKPLWEFGLIDIVEYEESSRNSQKPKNIVIYEYPFHEIERKYKPLEKLRDWDTDFQSASKEFGKTGGRPRRKNEITDEADVKKRNRFKLVKSIKKYTLVKTRMDGFKNETVDGFKNETVTVSNLKPNNYTNNSINISNAFNNLSNKREEEEEKAGAKSLLLYLTENEILIENANDFIKTLEVSNLSNYTNEQCLLAIDLSLIDFENGHCNSPYKWAVGKLERLLDGRLDIAKSQKQVKEANKLSKRLNNKSKEIVPDWFYKQNEKKTSTTDPIFEERMREAYRNIGLSEIDIELKIHEYQQQNKADFEN